MRKHAYLIIAHKQPELLHLLISLVDDSRNDIYIHIDKKATDFDEDYIKSSAKKSSVFFIRRMKVTWGGYSQIKCTLRLLKQAVKLRYDYYHLLSGSDLPIKNQNYIHDFFTRNAGKEFVHFDAPAIDPQMLDRIKYYRIASRKRPCARADNMLVSVQRLLNVNRLRKSSLTFQKGSNWVSITHEFASYVLSREKHIKKLFRLSFCADELLIQTLICNSGFAQSVYTDAGLHEGYMRMIDWSQGYLHIFTVDDYDRLITSPYLFARKFNEDSSGKLPEMIRSYVLEENSL